ncbi:MAG: ATP-binding protein [Vampirovibrionales bacterium]|nr:ATP-binding protein [Vampirovibrionales bacterium]
MPLPVTRLLYDDLRLIVEKLQSPVALLDGQGSLDTLSAAALPLWQTFNLNGDWLAEAEPQSQTLSTILPRLLSLNIPTWVCGLDDTLLVATPLSPAPEHKPGKILPQKGYWLEWLSGWDQAAASDELASLSEQLAIYQDVAQAVNSSLILEDIFESLADVIARYIPYDEAVILILDDSQNGIKLLVRMYPDGTLDISGENNAFAGYDPVVDMALSKQKLQTYPARPSELADLADKAEIGKSSEISEQKVKSPSGVPKSLVLSDAAEAALVVPLVNKGIIIGLIALSSNGQTLSTGQSAYNSSHRKLLLQISTQLAVAVENARLYWQTQAQASREFLINQLTMAIRQSLDIDVILSTAVMELGKVLGVSRCYIRYFESTLTPSQAENADPQTTPLKTTRLFAYHMPGIQPLSEWDPNDTQTHEYQHEAFEQRVFQFRKEPSFNPFILNDVRDCPSELMEQAFFDKNQIKSIAIIPLLVRNTLVGTMTLHQCESYRAWVMEDIELVKAMAEHLGVALHQATLFHTLDTQNRQLEETLSELQQAQLYLIQSEKMAVLGQFVAGIAHEVNTPLGTVMSNTDTLRACLTRLKGTLAGKPADDGQERVLSSMGGLLDLNKMAGERILEIVKNLRNFARLDESELKTADLHEGIESTLLVMGSSIPNGVEIIKAYDPKLPSLTCYPGLLNQVFLNLLVNATHALEDKLKEDKLKLEAKNKPAITIQTVFDEKARQISVHFRDNGKGIPPENLARIFDPGFTTKGAGVGTGLGLALCYRIVEKHKGHILVDSTVGQGTTFTVLLPCLKQ